MSSQSYFDQFEPQDGFRVTEHDMGRIEISLHVGLKFEGLWVHDDVSLPIIEVWTASIPTPADYGRRSRAKLLLEAICRYFSTGGDWTEFNHLTDKLKHVISGGLVYPEHHLFDSYLDTNGDFTAIWVKDGTDQVVRWVEDSFIDSSLTLQDLQREAEEDPDAESTGFESAGSGHYLTALPTETDNGSAGEDAESDSAEVQEPDVEG